MPGELEVLGGLFAFVHAAPLLGIVAYVRAEAAHRHHWERIAMPPIELRPSAYRSGGPMLTGYQREAPDLVRLAAAFSILFGSMFLPGLAWVLLGLFINGVGLVGIPGLFVAACLWRAGHGLLRGTTDAIAGCMRAAFYALVLNLAILLGAVVFRVGWPDSLPPLLLLGASAYAVLSVAQAWLLVQGARTARAARRGEVEGFAVRDGWIAADGT